MADKPNHRTWLSPVTFLTFLVVSISGLLLVFHIRIGNIKALHEWVGYAFTAAGMVHLLFNWKAFAAYFRNRSASLAVCICIVISLGIMCTEAKQRPNPMIQLLDANKNGVLDESEIADASLLVKKLDVNNDGIVSNEELQSKPGSKGPKL